MAQMGTAWPEANAVAAAGIPEWSESPVGEPADRSAADFSRVGLILCFLSAVLTLAGIGSALERIF